MFKSIYICKKLVVILNRNKKKMVEMLQTMSQLNQGSDSAMET